MERVRIRDTDGDEFIIALFWDGAVIRNGKIIREPLPAKLWQVGDIVECLYAPPGQRLRPVRFTIANVQVEQNTPEGERQ